MADKRRDSRGRILRNGEVQRTDGKYMYRYTDQNGKRRSLYSWRLVSTDAVPEGKRECTPLRTLEQKVQKDLMDGIDTDTASRTTLDELFDSFMESRRDLRFTTRYNYISLYNTNLRDMFGSRPVSSIRHSEILGHYTSLVHDNGCKPSTIRSIHNILSQLLEMAVLDNIIRANPAANVMRKMRRIMSETEKRHALTPQEQNALVDFVYSSPTYKRYAPLITVLLGTGMRISEALGLRWDDCDLKGGFISVNHELLYKASEDGRCTYRVSFPKTKAGVRSIPMFDDVRNALLAERKKKQKPGTEKFSVDGFTNFVFLNSKGKPYTNSAINNTLQCLIHTYNQAERLASIKENREACYLPDFSPHILRHTFCTRLCENEPNIKVVQEVMGHKDSRTTMNIYNEAIKEVKQSTFKVIEGKIKLS